jgi:hypothetical protein
MKGCTGTAAFPQDFTNGFSYCRLPVSRNAKPGPAAPLSWTASFLHQRMEIVTLMTNTHPGACRGPEPLILYRFQCNQNNQTHYISRRHESHPVC